MKKFTKQRNQDDLRPEYDFAAMKGGVRGKYYQYYCKGATSVRVASNNRSFDSAPARLQKTQSEKAGGRSAQDDKV